MWRAGSQRKGKDNTYIETNDKLLMINNRDAMYKGT